MDFVIGVSIFLVTVGVVFGMIPSLIDPFEESPDDSITADRIASQLVDGLLTDPARQGVLDDTCTYAFFDEAHGDGAECAIPFNESESDLATRLNVSARYTLNVSIKRDIDGDQSTEILCTDGSKLSDCSGGAPTQLAAGPTPPTHQSTFAARRTAHLDRKDITLEVALW